MAVKKLPRSMRCDIVAAIERGDNRRQQ